MVQNINGSDKGFLLSFYEGNAYMITLFEYKDDIGEDSYDMMWFFLDKEHAKRCLGLAKNADGEKGNILDDNSQIIDGITIYRNNCREWKSIADLFLQAFPDIQVTILNNDPNAE